MQTANELQTVASAACASSRVPDGGPAVEEAGRRCCCTMGIRWSKMSVVKFTVAFLMASGDSVVSAHTADVLHLYCALEMNVPFQIDVGISGADLPAVQKSRHFASQ